MQKAVLMLAMLTSLLWTSCHRGVKPSSVTLNVYMPTELAFQEIFDLFEYEHGVHVNLTYYKEPERMYEKISRGSEDFDLIIAPADYVSALIRDNAFLEIDKALVPNYIDILGEDLLGLSYDYSNRFSVPYMVRAMGLNVDGARLTKEAASSWDVLGDPNYARLIGLRNDERSLLGIALKHLNYSANTVNEEEIIAAKEVVLAWLANEQPLITGNQSRALIDGQLVASYDFPDAQMLEAYHSGEAPNYQFVLVPEGAMVEAQSMAILGSSEYVQEVHTLMRHLLEAPVQAKLVDHFGGISLVKHVDALRKYPFAYQLEDLTSNNYEARSGVDSALRYYNTAWQEILTQYNQAKFTQQTQQVADDNLTVK